MSKADQTTFGLQHGKIGDRIAVVLDGKQIYKKLYSPTNPRTPEQQKHRAKLAFINRLAKQLAPAVNLGFSSVPEKGSGMSPRNAFSKENWNNGSLMWNEEEGVWEICHQRLLLANGPLFIDREMSATVSDGRLHIVCPNPGLTDSHATPDDRLMVAVFIPTSPSLTIFAGPLREASAESHYELPEEVEAEQGAMHVYAWFEATRYHRATNSHITISLEQASRSVYLGAF